MHRLERVYRKKFFLSHKTRKGQFIYTDWWGVWDGGKISVLPHASHNWFVKQWPLI